MLELLANKYDYINVVDVQTAIKSGSLRDLMPVIRQQFCFGVEVVPICELKTLWVKRYLMRLLNKGALNDVEHLEMLILTEELLYRKENAKTRKAKVVQNNLQTVSESFESYCPEI